MWARAALVLLLAASAAATDPTPQTLAVCHGYTHGDRKCKEDVTHRVCARIGEPESTFWRAIGQRSWCNRVTVNGVFHNMDDGTWPMLHSCLDSGVQLWI